MSVEMPQNYPLVTWRDNSHGGIKAIESSWILLSGPGWVSSKCQFCPIGLPSIGGLHGSCGVLSSLLIVEASLFEGLSVSSPTLKNSEKKVVYNKFPLGACNNFIYLLCQISHLSHIQLSRLHM